MGLQLTLIQPSQGRVPSFERTLSALGDIPSILYRAVEFGTAQNREFFERMSENERPRPHIREMIVRDQAKRFLQRNDFQVEEDAVTVGNEPLSAPDRPLWTGPSPGAQGSRGVVPAVAEILLRRRRFYNANLRFVPCSQRQNGTDEAKPPSSLGFRFGFQPLNQLWLACPMRGGETSGGCSSALA